MVKVVEKLVSTTSHLTSEYLWYPVYLSFEFDIDLFYLVILPVLDLLTTESTLSTGTFTLSLCRCPERQWDRGNRCLSTGPSRVFGPFHCKPSLTWVSRNTLLQFESIMSLRTRSFYLFLHSTFLSCPSVYKDSFQFTWLWDFPTLSFAHVSGLWCAPFTGHWTTLLRTDVWFWHDWTHNWMYLLPTLSLWDKN